MNESKVECKYCNITLKSKHSGLRAHAKIKNHLDAISPFAPGVIATIPFKKKQRQKMQPLGLGTDNASVMVGVNNGVIALLRKKKSSYYFGTLYMPLNPISSL